MLINETEELVDINLDSRGELLPPKTNKIALIDADTIAYASCSTCEYEIEALPKSIDENSESEWHIDINEAYEHSLEKINLIMDRTGTEECELHFTSGKKSFRHDIYKDYKANRKGRSPVGLQQLKEMLSNSFAGKIHTEIEADDWVVYAYLKDPEKYILCCVDKDIIGNVQECFNYYENPKYEREMCFISNTMDHVRAFPYRQCLIGDTTDNIKGAKGIGKVRAEKLIPLGLSESKMWNIVVKAFGGKEDEATLNMRLVSMRQLDIEGNLKLWTSKGIR